MDDFLHDIIYNEKIQDFLHFSLCEDYNNNLSKCLLNKFSWNDKKVLEAGIGMGRIADNYIDKIKSLTATDKSMKMLKYCEKKFSLKTTNVQYLCCHHKNLKMALDNSFFDTFLCAYSLSYAAIEYDGNHLYDFLDRIFSIEANNYIIIENVGIFSTEDEYIRPYSNYFNYLYKMFDCIQINTDFCFRDNMEAVHYSNMFFGKEIASIVKKSESNFVPEKTCIWYK